MFGYTTDGLFYGMPEWNEYSSTATGWPPSLRVFIWHALRSYLLFVCFFGLRLFRLPSCPSVVDPLHVKVRRHLDAKRAQGLLQRGQREGQPPTGQGASNGPMVVK